MRPAPRRRRIVVPAWLVGVLIAVLAAVGRPAVAAAAAPPALTQPPGACATAPLNAVLSATSAHAPPLSKSRLRAFTLLAAARDRRSSSDVPGPRWGNGPTHDDLAVGLTVYVNGDPVNLVDPDGHISRQQYNEEVAYEAQLPAMQARENYDTQQRLSGTSAGRAHLQDTNGPEQPMLSNGNLVEICSLKGSALHVPTACGYYDWFRKPTSEDVDALCNELRGRFCYTSSVIDYQALHLPTGRTLYRCTGGCEVFEPKPMLAGGEELEGLAAALRGAEVASVESLASVDASAAEVVSGIEAELGGSVGAFKRPIYAGSPKHGAFARGDIGAAPTNGQATLDWAVQLRATSARMVGVDPETGEIVVFDETHPGQGIYHGHVRSYDQLTTQMQNVLNEFGLADRQGNILLR